MKVELGISTFGETTLLEKTGEAISHDERIRDLLEEITLADKLGIDVYAIGKHHRKDFAVSAPEIVLAMAAAQTKQIHLSSATTNLPTIDPIRVYEQYATIDAAAPDGLRSWRAAAPLPKPLTCSAMTSRITTNSSRKSLRCW